MIHRLGRYVNLVNTKYYWIFHNTNQFPWNILIRVFVSMGSMCSMKPINFERVFLNSLIYEKNQNEINS